MVPKAFISHASEDKERFVISFATLLREHGVEAWLDKWEMLPGDSLVDRIFEEAIRTADAFIVVLSTNSVNKPWVREELNAGFVNRISGKCRLIPVVIDDCEVPECLKSTLWEKVHSLDDIGNHVKRIANTIHGITDKPPVGRPPRHVSTTIDIFPDLTKQDQLVFAIACGLTLDTGWPLVNFANLRPLLIEQGLSEEEIIESVRVLQGRRFVQARGAHGSFSSLNIAASAFDTYLKATMANYSVMVDEICLQILNCNARTNSEIQEATGYRPRLVNHVMEMLGVRGLVNLHKSIGGYIGVTAVSPELPRHFRNRIAT